MAYAYSMCRYGAPFLAVGDPNTLAVDSLPGNRLATATATLMHAKGTTLHQGNVANYRQFHGAPEKEACRDASSHPECCSEPVTNVINHMSPNLQRQTSENSLQHTQSSKKGRRVIRCITNVLGSTSSARRMLEKTSSQPAADIPCQWPSPQFRA